VRSIGGFAPIDKVLFENSFGSVWQRKRLERPPNVAANIAQLKPANEDGVEGSPGNNAKLTARGNRIGEAPAGNTDTHAALNYDRKIGHVHRIDASAAVVNCESNFTGLSM
jgi:hypothetical protein